MNENSYNLKLPKSFIRKSLRDRIMKNRDQTKVLENEFQKSSEWNREKIQYLSKILKLSYHQIYKWNWDRRLYSRIIIDKLE